MVTQELEKLWRMTPCYILIKESHVVMGVLVASYPFNPLSRSLLPRRRIRISFLPKNIQY